MPHKVIDFALDFFHVPECVKNIIVRYFNNLHMCFPLEGSTTGWQHLEGGITMGCAISPILFVTSSEGPGRLSEASGYHQGRGSHR